MYAIYLGLHICVIDKSRLRIFFFHLMETEICIAIPRRVEYVTLISQLFINIQYPGLNMSTSFHI